MYVCVKRVKPVLSFSGVTYIFCTFYYHAPLFKINFFPSKEYLHVAYYVFNRLIEGNKYF